MRKQWNSVQRFSLRKFSTGLASVLLATMFMSQGVMAHESSENPKNTEVVNPNKENTVTNVQPKATEGVANGKVESAEQPAIAAEVPQPTTILEKEKEKIEGPKVTFNTTKLEALIKEVEGLDLEKYTEESVKKLNVRLSKAKDALVNAKSQKEINSAYNALVGYKNTGLKRVPKLKEVEHPKPDTTNGKETVGIRAENTEPNGTNIAGHNHSLNGTTRAAGSGFRDANTELTDIEWGIKSGFGDSYRTNDRRVFVVRNDDSTFKVPIKIVSGSNNITELTATSASGASLTLTPKNVGSKNAVLTVSGRFSDSKKGSDVINVTVKTGSRQKTFQVGVYHPFQKPTIEVPSNVPQGTTINDYLKDKAGTKPTINVTLPVAPKIPTGAEMKVYLIGSYDSTDYTQDDQNQNPHDYDILATKTVTEGNTTVTIEESDYKKNLPAREIRALTVIELSTELSGKSPDTNPGIRGSYYSDPATVGNPTPAVDKSGALSAITRESEKQNSLIDSKQNVFTSKEVTDFKAMVTRAAQTAKDNINKTDTDTETKVNTERDKGILALDKIGAIVEVEAAKKAKDTAIEGNANITDKATAKAAIQTAADAAKTEINKDTTNTADKVTTEKAKGLLGIEKAGAIAEIDAAQAAKDAAIESNANITDKAAAKAVTKAAADAAKAEINKTETNTADKVTTEKEKGLLGLEKAGAIAEIDAAQAAKDAAIESNANITDKAAAKAVTKAAADAAKAEINKDTTNTAALVTTEKEKGLLGLEKAGAIVAIDAAKAAKDAAIDTNNTLTPSEKAEVKAEVARIRNQAIADVREATDVKAVENITNVAVEAILNARPTRNYSYPSGTSTNRPQSDNDMMKSLLAKKEEAKMLIEQEAMKKKAEISQAELSESEKALLDARVDQEKAEDFQMIDQATMIEEVNQALKAGIEAIRSIAVASANGRMTDVTPEESEESMAQAHRQVLPQTGTGNEVAIFGAAASAILAGLGLVVPSKKKED